jgi:hypothetical protein
MKQDTEHSRHSRRSFIVRALALMALPILHAGRSSGAIAKKPMPQFDLAFMKGKVTLMRRREWTKGAPVAWRLREGGQFDRITIHHQGGGINRLRNHNAVVAAIDSVYAGHRHKNYGDIAYHFIIDYAGRVWEGRSLAYEGAHVSHNNKNNIGILVLGNFEKQNPSQDSLASMRNLVGVLRSRFGIKHHRVYGHRDIGSSLCPGKNLYPHVVAIRSSGADKVKIVA